MGFYDDCLFINGDSTLEVAMEMLCVVGLGPKNYAARRGEKACFLFRAKPDGEWRTGFEGPPGATDIGETGKAAIDAIHEKYGADIILQRFSGRHTVAEYEEFFACWRAATGRHKLLENHFEELVNFCPPYVHIRDLASGARGLQRCLVGSAYHLLILLLMQNGCALPAGFKETVMLDSLANDMLCTDPAEYSRRVFVRKVRDLVVDYDERGGHAVEYVIESFAELTTRPGRSKDKKARALYVAETFDARVKRSSFSRGPPPRRYSDLNFKKVMANDEDLRAIRQRCVGDTPAAREDKTEAPRDDPLSNHPGKVARAAKKQIKQSAHLDVEQCCAGCGKWSYGADANVALSRCARCLAIYYCSPECQKKDWKRGHKQICKKMKADREAARASELVGAAHNARA